MLFRKVKRPKVLRGVHCYSLDRKSTRLNSSHRCISYAVFCLKKKTQITMIRGRHTFVWGGQLEMGYDNYLQTNTGGGLISFNVSWTQSLARNAAGATDCIVFD